MKTNNKDLKKLRFFAVVSGALGFVLLFSVPSLLMSLIGLCLVVNFFAIITLTNLLSPTTAKYVFTDDNEDASKGMFRPISRGGSDMTRNFFGGLKNDPEEY